jgi:predicted 2-oxoglutarate/Fe(II)-dependent dioxygenase YbiX
MPAIPLELARVLQTVRRPGDFFATGRIEIFAPKIEVEGVGAISLPLLEAQAGQLIAIAEQAPYGRGEETLVDTAVRRTWQIAAERIRLGGRHWDANLAEIVARAAAGLGVMEGVAADLYKLLVYDTGSFFVRHRDTEKAPGMFATLVVVLPSLYTGGELCIRHREREVCLDLSSPEPSEVAYAAFYADCRHEVRPITAGCRLVLIYNLIRQARAGNARPPAYDAEIERISDLLRSWAAEPAAAERSSPSKLIYPLEHAYTPAEIGFRRSRAPMPLSPRYSSAPPAGELRSHLAISGDQGKWQCRVLRLVVAAAGVIRSRTTMISRCSRSATSRDALRLAKRPTAAGPHSAKCPSKTRNSARRALWRTRSPTNSTFFEATGNEGASF